MNWAEKETTTNAECEEIRTHLLSLGFPETILDDLKEEDLLECRNARRVLTETNDYPINDGGGSCSFTGWLYAVFERI